MNKKNNSRTVFYCRKSSESDDRQALSIESQIDECKQLAERLNIFDYEIIKESKSAKQPGRPYFSDMMTRINKLEIDTIICWKLDRLARNPLEGSSLIWMLEQKFIKRIITIEQTYLPEENHIMMHLIFGMASQYSRDLSVNVKRGNKKKFELGWWTTVAPLGYLNNSDKRGEPIIKDPDSFEQIKRMWEFLATGNYSIPEVLKLANEEWGLKTPQRTKSGGTKLPRSSAYRIFSNPFYYGYMIRGENEGWGKHEPMITEELFNKVQDIINAKGNTRQRERNFGFKGIIKCGECGCTVTAEETINRHKKSYTYYHCTKKRNKGDFKCLQPFIRVEDLEDQIIEALKSFKIPDTFHDWLINYSKYCHKIETEQNNKLFKQKVAEQEEIQRNIDELVQMKFKKLLDDEEFLAQKRLLLSQKKNVEEYLSSTNAHADKWLDLCLKICDFAKNAQEWFRIGSLKQKNEILLTIGSEFILKDGKLIINWHKPFEILQDGHDNILLYWNRVNWLEPLKTSTNFAKNMKNQEKVKNAENEWLEPSKNTIFIEKNDFENLEHLIWRRERDLNPR